ncbi:MAG: hypothetical protein K2X66_08195 [Cyanobacteria bacterium]|nr:hypothetical protein [Cyanobacteriota bacterium]
MPITFDSLDELKDFYRHFQLIDAQKNTQHPQGKSAKQALSDNEAEPFLVKAPQGKNAKKEQTISSPSGASEKRRPGRPPKASAIGIPALPKTKKQDAPVKVKPSPKKEKGLAKAEKKPAKTLTSKAKLLQAKTAKSEKPKADKKLAKLASVAPSKIASSKNVKTKKADSKTTKLKTASAKDKALKAKTLKPSAKASPKALKEKPVKSSLAGEKRPKGRPKAPGTLTAKINETIQKFVTGKKKFTANDIFDDLAKREKGVNKQSVITSVLKQMNNHFQAVSVSEQPGAGPRPVKLYTP